VISLSEDLGQICDLSSTYSDRS